MQRVRSSELFIKMEDSVGYENIVLINQLAR